MKFGLVFLEELLFKDISFWSSGGHFVQRRTICAILVEVIKRNNSVSLFRIWTSGSGGDVF